MGTEDELIGIVLDHDQRWSAAVMKALWWNRWCLLIKQKQTKAGTACDRWRLPIVPDLLSYHKKYLFMYRIILSYQRPAPIGVFYYVLHITNLQITYYNLFTEHSQTTASASLASFWYLLLLTLNIFYTLFLMPTGREWSIFQDPLQIFLPISSKFKRIN